MIYITLENGEQIFLKNKSLLLIDNNSTTISIVNDEDDYEIICFCECIDRTFDVRLNQPAIIVLENCVRTKIAVSAGMAGGLSQAITIGGKDNTIEGLEKQNTGEFISGKAGGFNLSTLTAFKKIILDTL